MSEETQRYVGRCLFCHLGDEDKRGVLELSLSSETPLFSKVTDIGYKCALGEVGKECAIPELFKRNYEASQIGRKGDHDASVRRTTF